MCIQKKKTFLIDVFFSTDSKSEVHFFSPPLVLSNNHSEFLIIPILYNK